MSQEHRQLTGSQALLQQIASALYELKITAARKELDERYAVILGELGLTGRAGEFKSREGLVFFVHERTPEEEGTPEPGPKTTLRKRRAS